MNLRNVLAAFVALATVLPSATLAANADKPPSYAEARGASRIVTTELVESLKNADPVECPGTHAWVKDFRAQTKGFDEDLPMEKWPTVDVGALVDHNPNFWRMYFEIAPADPMLSLIHAGLLLSQGEAKRAAYVIELARHRPGIPKRVLEPLGMLQNSAIAALKASDEVTEEGIKLFDKGDYDAAMSKYREAHKLCPTNGSTFYEMGYTLRTKAEVARGEKPAKPGTIEVNGKSQDSPEVVAALAGARLHDPLMFMAYQGTHKDVIKAALAMAKQVMPAWKTLRAERLAKDEEYHALEQLSEGLSEAGVHDLAIFVRQLMAARRNSYDQSDFPIFRDGLRKLAPGPAIEDILSRLAGKTMKFRPLTQLEDEEGQPAQGSGWRLYIPDKPVRKPDPNQPVYLDEIRLLTSEDDIAKRAGVEDLVRFTKDIQKTAEDVLGKCTKPAKVLVEFSCTSSGHKVVVMHQPKDVDEEPLSELYEALAKIKKLTVKEQTVQFQIKFTVTPTKATQRGKK